MGGARARAELSDACSSSWNRPSARTARQAAPEALALDRPVGRAELDAEEPGASLVPAEPQARRDRGPGRRRSRMRQRSRCAGRTRNDGAAAGTEGLDLDPQDAVDDEDCVCTLRPETAVFTDCGGSSGVCEAESGFLTRHVPRTHVRWRPARAWTEDAGERKRTATHSRLRRSSRGGGARAGVVSVAALGSTILRAVR